MFCGNCGKKLDDSAAFCDACGARVVREAATDTVQKAPEQKSASGKKSSKKNIIIIISICLVAALAAVIVFLLLNNSDLTEDSANQEYIKLLDENRESIVEFEQAFGVGGVAYFDFNDSAIPDLAYVTKCNKKTDQDKGYELHIAFDSGKKIVKHSVAVDDCFAFCRNKTDSMYYLYMKTDNSSDDRLYTLQRITFDGDQFSVEAPGDNDVSQSAQNADVSVMVSSAEKEDLDPVFGSVSGDESLHVDEARELISTASNDTDSTIGEEETKPTEPQTPKVIDIDSSELPGTLKNLLFYFQANYRVDDNSTYHKEFDCTDLEACYSTFAGEIANTYSCVCLKDYPDIQFEMNFSKKDPLNRFQNNGYTLYEEDDIIWIMENIFHIGHDDALEMIQLVLKDNQNLYEYEDNGKKYLCCITLGKGDPMTDLSYETVRYDGERYYIVYDYYSSYYVDNEEIKRFYAEVSEVEIDGVKYWTLYKHSESIPELPEADTETTASTDILSEFAGEYFFSSGVGGWGTWMELKADGTFSGSYGHNSIGERGEGYDGTLYAANFSGKFSDPKKINAYTYSFEITDVVYENEFGTEEIKEENGVKRRYVYVEAYGIAGASTVYAYTADAPTAAVPSQLMSWIQLMRSDAKNDPKLAYRCLYMPDIEAGWRGPKG